MSQSLRRGLFDYHIGEHVSEIVLDSKTYVEQVRRMGIEVLLCMTKDAMGTSYYDTRFGRKNKLVAGDIVGEIVEHCRKHNIKVIGYYNVSLDDYLSAEHPDWRQCDAQGNSELVYDYYTAPCLNTPYREIVRNQLAELARNYALSGLWFDITYIFDGRCFCKWCRKRFSETYGTDMNDRAEPGSEDFRLLREFRINTRYSYIKEFVEEARAIRGDEFEMGWNQAGDLNFAQVEVDRLASHFYCELHAPNYLDGLRQGAWMRNFGKPFALMIPEGLSGWGDWTVSPLETKKLMAGIALSQGGALTMGHVALPCGEYAGKVADAVVDQYRQLAQWIKRREQWCTGAKPVPSAAVLNPISNFRLTGTIRGGWQDYVTDSVCGAHKMLAESHWPVDIITEETPEPDGLEDLSK